MNLSDQLKSIATEGAKEAGAEVSPEMDELLQSANIRNSLNGDPIGYCIDSLSIKLTFALQDRSVLGEIEPEEIEALILTVKAYKESKKEGENVIVTV